LIYISDIPRNTHASLSLFADDTSLLLHEKDPVNASHKLNQDLKKIQEWATKWLITYNGSKSNYMRISHKKVNNYFPPLYLNNVMLMEATDTTYLGLTINNKLSWKPHISRITKKASTRLRVLEKYKYAIPRESLTKTYNSMVRSVLEYGNILIDDCTLAEAAQLEHIHRKGALICSRANKRTESTLLFKELNWDTLKERRKSTKIILIYKIENNTTPKYLKDSMPQNVANRSNYHTRNHRNINTIRTRTERMKKSVIPSSISLWNNLGSEFTEAKYGPINKFKALLRKQWYNRSQEKLHNYNVGLHSHIIAQMRMGLCSLKGQLAKYNIISDGSCQLCKARSEDITHYLLNCPAHANARTVLMQSVSHLIDIRRSSKPVILSKLLHGCSSYTSFENITILTALHTFIDESRRFTATH